MVELSENARRGLDDYLRQVRWYLRWSKSVDRSEVEQNIAEHIERELEDAPEPVSPSALDGVLARLGSPVQVVFFAASFLTARAALAAGDGEDLDAQKWLPYPALLIVSAAFASTLLAGPGFLAGVICVELHKLEWIRFVSNMGLTAFIVVSVTLVTGLWWMLLGLLTCKWPGLIRHALHPFADGFNRRCALAVFGAGLLLLVLLAGFTAISIA